MKQRAKVVQLQDNNMAQVSVIRQSACGENCATCKAGCTPAMNVSAIARNDAQAAEGDFVFVESVSSKILGFAVLVYLLPFILFFLFYGLAGLTKVSETIRILLGGAGFAVSLLISVAVSKKCKDSAQSLLIITRVIGR